MALGVRELTPEIMRSTVGFVLKNSEDIETMAELLLSGEEQCDCGGACEHGEGNGDCAHHHHHHA